MFDLEVPEEVTDPATFLSSLLLREEKYYDTDLQENRVIRVAGTNWNLAKEGEREKEGLERKPVNWKNNKLP